MMGSSRERRLPKNIPAVGNRGGDGGGGHTKFISSILHNPTPARWGKAYFPARVPNRRPCVLWRCIAMRCCCEYRQA